MEPKDERFAENVGAESVVPTDPKDPLVSQSSSGPQEEVTKVLDEVISEEPKDIPLPTSTTVRDKEEKQGKVRLTSCEFGGGLTSFRLEVDPQFVQECYIHDKEWDEGFRKFVGPNYPYTMSPKTSQAIATLGTELKKRMFDSGFEIDPWKIEPEEEPYVLGVLRRVTVTDTIEPIIGYTDHMAKHLMSIKEKDPNHVLSVRSFFCGASVADKSLITRLYELGATANLVATDLAADSIAIAALNFSVWNELLPEQDRYEIHIVKGDIPSELYGRDRTIVLQVEDARTASRTDSRVAQPKYDALLLDNGLQYIKPDFTRELIENVVKNMGVNGLYVGALGLDAGIKVDIPKSYHIPQIAKSFFTDLRKDYARKGTSKAPYEYPHKYRFSNDPEKNLITISGVISDGAARMYTWLGQLLLKDRAKFKEVMDAIKSATELSKANKIVETTPFDYHQVMVEAMRSAGLEVEELEVPLDYESFGWKKVGDDLYTNGKETVDGGTMMRLCRLEDPLVLRRSRLYVKGK